MLNSYRALRLRPQRAVPARIAPPALVLWGSEDRFLGRAVMDASTALCDEGRLVAIDGAGHWLHLEEPARVTAELLRSLAGPPTR